MPNDPTKETVENIDQAIFKFINEELDLFTTTNKGRKKVPIIWVSAERAHQIKNNRDVRDDNGVLKLVLPKVSPEERIPQSQYIEIS